MENQNLCIICVKNANATGSHIVPANLIKNCVGLRNYEESFKFDLIKRTSNMFLGTSNPKTFPENKSELKNISISEIHHYVADYILCTDCEKKLGVIEGFIYKEFLEKARVDKFKNIFTIDKFEVNDLISSNKIKPEMFYCYFYSIILRIDKFSKINSGKSIIINEHIINISNFLKGYLYEQEADFTKYIKEYGLLVHLKNQESESIALSQVNILKYPIFNLCEFNLIFYTDVEFKNPFSCYLNKINDEKFNIVSNSKVFDNIFCEDYIEHCDSITLENK